MTEARRKHILPLALLLSDYLEERYAASYAAHHAYYAAHHPRHADYAANHARHVNYAASYAFYSEAPPLIPLVYKAFRVKF